MCLAVLVYLSLSWLAWVSCLSQRSHVYVHAFLDVHLFACIQLVLGRGQQRILLLLTPLMFFTFNAWSYRSCAEGRLLLAYAV